MTPDEYESLVSGIVSGICESVSELRDLRLDKGRSNRILGSSGYKHQIDVSVFGAGTLYLIECKRWKAKIGVDEVMVLASRVSDIVQVNADVHLEAILASENGATRGAKLLAGFFHIQLETVRSAHEFGMRMGSHIKVGMADAIQLCDSLTCTVSPAHARTQR